MSATNALSATTAPPTAAPQAAPSRTPIRRLRRTAVAGVLLVGIAVFASACGSGSSSPGVAADGGGSTPAVSSTAGSGSAVQKALAYASCMRSHGVTNFPDPNSQGTFEITSSDGINIESSQYTSAAQACKSLAPTTGGSPAQNQAAALKFSECMRSHGVTNFPDPNASGGFEIGESSGINSGTPQFHQAQAACQKYLPGASSGSGAVTSGGAS